MSHLGPKLWNLLPEEYKEIDYVKNIYNTWALFEVAFIFHSFVHARDSQTKFSLCLNLNF